MNMFGVDWNSKNDFAKLELESWKWQLKVETINVECRALEKYLFTSKFSILNFNILQSKTKNWELKIHDKQYALNF